jgi:4'-phosphopantetheinyl transferase
VAKRSRETFRVVEPRVREWLSPSERARLSEFRRPEDAERFEIGAVLLRAAVADGRPDSSPETVHIDRACPECERQHGRPVVIDDRNDDTYVSVSHSGDYVIVAVTDVAPIGVDVEQRSPAMLDAVREICTPDEQFSTLDEAAALWVRKEAVLKATGEGFRRDPTTVRVGTSGTTDFVGWLDDDGPTCRLYDLTIDRDHHASLAVLAPTRVEIERRNADDLWPPLPTRR